MPSDPDLPLLQAIAQQRDQKAFETLFTSHKKAAFSLAVSITNRWDRAEEALQSAMLAVWRAADKFQPREGATVRSWLLRIVARESLKVLRKLRQDRTEKWGDEGILEMAANMDESKEGLESQEALASMRAALVRLSAPDRQLVALVYGAEMTHQEVAQELALPRRTISRRLEDILAGLRTNLKEAGFTAAVPAALSKGLESVILSGCEPPLVVQEQILRSVSGAGGEAAHSVRSAEQVSRRAVAVKSTVSTWVAVGLVAASAGGAWWWQDAHSTPASAAPERLPAKAPEETREAPAVLQPEVAPVVPKSVLAPDFNTYTRLVLSFDQGPYDGLFLMQGEWKWSMNPKLKRGMMVVPKNQLPAVFAFPSFVLQRPFRFTVTITVAGRQGLGGVDAMWGGEHEVAGYRRYMNRLDSTDLIKYEIYGFGKHLVSCNNGHVTLVQEYENPYPGDRIFISVLNSSLIEIAYDIYGTDENDLKRIPKEIQDVPALIAKMGAPASLPAVAIRPEFWKQAEKTIRK